MTFPTVESATQTDSGTLQTTHALSYPATVNSGDLLILCAAADGGTRDPTGNPTGYSSLANDTSQATGTLYCYYKSASGSEGGGTEDVVYAANTYVSGQI